MGKDKTLEKIRDSIEDAIKPILKKGEAMTPADLESLTKAVCVIEKIKTIEQIGSYGDGYSENVDDDSGNSYRRGRSPVTGRFVSRDAYHDSGANMRHYYDTGASTRRYYDGAEHDGYSGHSIQDRMIDQLERMMDEAKTEHERQTVRNWIARLQNK